MLTEGVAWRHTYGNQNRIANPRTPNWCQASSKLCHGQYFRNPQANSDKWGFYFAKIFLVSRFFSCFFGLTKYFKVFTYTLMFKLPSFRCKSLEFSMNAGGSETYSLTFCPKYFKFLTYAVEFKVYLLEIF